jgi:hypothetical protein
MPPARVVRVGLVTGSLVTLVSLAVLLVLTRYAARPAPGIATPVAVAASQGAPWPVPGPTIRSSELWFATTPAPGVWAELKVVLDNPLPAGPTRTTLLVSGTILEDYRIRTTEPKLVTPPRRRPDGRYALVFPAPIPESLNWFRIYLECRNSTPRPLALGFMLDGARNVAEQPPVPAQVYFADRQADPFLVVPEAVVRWVPGEAHTALPVLVAYAVILGVVAAAGCAAAFWAVRR